MLNKPFGVPVGSLPVWHTGNKNAFEREVKELMLVCEQKLWGRSTRSARPRRRMSSVIHCWNSMSMILRCDDGLLVRKSTWLGNGFGGAGRS